MPRDVVLARAPRARLEVVLEVRVSAGGLDDLVEGLACQRRAPEVRVHDDAGRDDRPPQPRLPRRAQLVGQVLPKVARIGSSADRHSSLLDHPPRRVHREGIVHLAGELVHGREVAKLHGKSLEWARWPSRKRFHTGT